MSSFSFASNFVDYQNYLVLIAGNASEKYLLCIFPAMLHAKGILWRDSIRCVANNYSPMLSALNR
jgi:hypothetical protein